ncbi:MAG: Kelch repeat-containing protein [Chthoniobacterales bacterium]
MSQVRVGHVATLLRDGKVLVVGGSDNQTPLASAEIYDPTKGSWTNTAPMVDAHVRQGQILLANGKVLAVSNGAGVCELYDPATGKWAKTGSLRYPRNHYAATLLPNGKVLVVGGYDDDISDDVDVAELYDPATGTWSMTGSLSYKRDGHSAVLLQNGKVLVAGGYINAVNYPHSREVKSTELYDPTKGIWSLSGTMNGKHTGEQTAILLADGKVLVIGGAEANDPVQAEVYDPASGAWKQVASPSTFRRGPTATRLPDGEVLLIGGLVASGWTDTTELYNSATNIWQPGPKLNEVRGYQTATLLANGQVLVAGGDGVNPAAQGALASAELYTSPASPRMRNISTRADVLTNDNLLIGGFIVNGAGPKTVLLRAIGPSTGVSGALPDPNLELHYPDGSVATNDDWKVDDATGKSQEADISSTNIAPKSDSESAILKILLPGSYTAVVKGKNGATGVSLVEVYDLDPDPVSQLANISTRGFVENGDNVMIGGFIVGQSSAQVLLRAIGPSLPVADALADPVLQVHDHNGAKLASNDDWKIDDSTGESQEAQIRATTVPPKSDRESALVLTLPAGEYTAVVAGKANTGVALVEAYRLE